MYDLSLDTSEVNRVIESANHAVIAVNQYFSNAGVDLTVTTYPWGSVYLTWFRVE